MADVAWASDDFMNTHGANTPYTVSPEICVEVVSPSNSQAEINEKIKLYLNQGAKEVWLCNQVDEISYFTSKGEIKDFAELNKT